MNGGDYMGHVRDLGRVVQCTWYGIKGQHPWRRYREDLTWNDMDGSVEVTVKSTVVPWEPLSCVVIPIGFAINIGQAK